MKIGGIKSPKIPWKGSRLRALSDALHKTSDNLHGTARPLYHAERVASKISAWKKLGAAPGILQTIRSGILDLPLNPIWNLPQLPAVPQDEADIAFGIKEIKQGIKDGF